MRLEQYLIEQDESQNAFSKRAGMVQSAVSRVCLGGDVRGRLWAKITTATRGRVHPSDHFPAPKREKRGR